MSDVDFQEFRDFCTYISQDQLLVQGAGGNASWKTKNAIWVTASGTWLEESSRQDIFLPIRQPAGIIDSILNDAQYIFETLNLSNKRPSIETSLHCLLEHTFVLHLHAINPLSLLVRKNAEQEISKRLTDKVPYIYIPYAKPGHELSKEVVSRLVMSDFACNILFLANHGIVISGETTEEIKINLNLVCEACEPNQIYKPAKLKQLKSILKIDNIIYEPVRETHLHALAADQHISWLTEHCWALYPDHIVFLGPEPLFIDHTDIALLSLKGKYVPFIFIKDYGVWQRQDVPSAVMLQLKCYYNVLVRLEKGSSVAKLTTSQVEELLVWDAEQHRLSLNK